MIKEYCKECDWYWGKAQLKKRKCSYCGHYTQERKLTKRAWENVKETRRGEE